MIKTANSLHINCVYVYASFPHISEIILVALHYDFENDHLDLYSTQFSVATDNVRMMQCKGTVFSSPYIATVLMNSTHTCMFIIKVPPLVESSSEVKTVDFTRLHMRMRDR